MSTLTFDMLRKANEERAIRWRNGSTADVPLSFAMMELAGEIGEACNAAKKLERTRLGLRGGTTDRTNLIEELADAIICIDLAARKLDIDLGDAVARKFNATSEKHGFPDRLPVEST